MFLSATELWLDHFAMHAEPHPDHTPIRLTEPRPLTGAEWADWDGRRGLVYAASGALYRCVLTGEPGGKGSRRPRLSKPTLLIDLTGDEPERRPSPPWARRW